MRIQRNADGQVFEGPDGTPLPTGFSLASSASSASPALARRALPEDPSARWRGAWADTFGLSDRPGAVRITSNKPGEKTPLGVVVNPQGPLERATSLAVTVPAYSMMPGGPAGRIALSGAMGALGGASRGKSLSGMGWDALLDMAITGLTEGLGRGASRYFGKRSYAFDKATDAPREALAEIRHRLTGPFAGRWMNVPSVSRANLTPDEAISALSQLEGKTYQVARAEIIDQLKSADRLAPKLFGSMTSPARFDPGVLSKAARHGLPQAQGALDALATHPVSGVPAGAVGGAAVMEGPRSIYDRLLRLLVP